MNKIFSFILLIALFTSCSSKKEVNDFNKFPGLWQMNDGETDLYEEWSKPQNNILYGKSYRMNDADSMIDERVTLKNEGEFFYYVVTGQNESHPVSFKMVNSTDSSFSFENKEHDFPQRIIYRFVGKDSLIARIEGDVNGELRSKDYYYHRIQNYQPK